MLELHVTYLSSWQHIQNGLLDIHMPKRHTGNACMIPSYPEMYKIVNKRHGNIPP